MSKVEDLSKRKQTRSQEADLSRFRRREEYWDYGFTLDRLESEEDREKMLAFARATGRRFYDPRTGVWPDVQRICWHDFRSLRGQIKKYSAFKSGTVAGMPYIQFSGIVYIYDEPDENGTIGAIRDGSYVDLGKWRIDVCSVIDKYIRPPLVLVKG
jgi:hypothetical protein